MSGRWWRAYDEALHDPKVLALSDRLHRAWFNLLCVASKNEGVLPAIATVAIELRVSAHKAAEYITALVVAGLLDEDEAGKFAPHNWGGRQFKSDVTDPTNATRQKRYRDRHAVTENTVTVTPPREQKTEAEADSEKKERSLRSRGARGSRLPADWTPTKEGTDLSIERLGSQAEGYAELERFRDYWTAKSGQQASKLDWEATWRNWVRTAAERKGKPNGHGRIQKISLSDRAHELAREVRERELAAGIGRPDDTFGSH